MTLWLNQFQFVFGLGNVQPCLFMVRVERQDLLKSLDRDRLGFTLGLRLGLFLGNVNPGTARTTRQRPNHFRMSRKVMKV